MTIERFERLLDSYGGDRARWPLSLAGSAEALLRASAEARRKLDEAQALDRLLDTPPVVDGARLGALADRILAQATSVPRGQPEVSAAKPAPIDRRGQIIRLPAPAMRAPRPVQPAARKPARARAFDIPWRAAAALAASLLMGVAIGLTDLGQTTTLSFASLSEVPASDTDVVISAVQYDTLNAIDEDQI